MCKLFKKGDTVFFKKKHSFGGKKGTEDAVFEITEGTLAIVEKYIMNEKRSNTCDVRIFISNNLSVIIKNIPVFCLKK